MAVLFSSIKGMLFLLLLPYFCFGQPAPSLLRFSIFLEPTIMVYLCWDHDEQEVMTFEPQVHTTGWVAFGFSPHGELPGSDIVIGGVFPNGSIYFSVSWKDFLCVPLCQGSCSRYIVLKAYWLNWLKIDVRGHLRCLVGVAFGWQSRRAQVFCRSCVIPASPMELPEIPYGIPDGTRCCYLGKYTDPTCQSKPQPEPIRYDWSHHLPWS